MVRRAAYSLSRTQAQHTHLQGYGHPGRWVNATRLAERLTSASMTPDFPHPGVSGQDPRAPWAAAALAMGGAGDYYKWQVSFSKKGSMWDHSGSGVWVGFAGLVVVVLGAGASLVVGKRRS